VACDGSVLQAAALGVLDVTKECRTAAYGCFVWHELAHSIRIQRLGALHGE